MFFLAIHRFHVHCLIMIKNIPLNTRIYRPSAYQAAPSFKSVPVQTLTHTNIGSCLEGFIGKVRVRNAADRQACYLDVVKKFIDRNKENYALKNEAGDIVGEIDVSIRKLLPNPYDCHQNAGDPSHVFVDNLRNYSMPGTPYTKKGLNYLKDIGTRLLQIAQRRSDEAGCLGNIKLISKNESKPWYLNVIGMAEEFPALPGFKFRIGNPNALYLPPHNKEPLSRLQGGL